jgi:aminoglycoside phosphotransferase (APT) family kinase protein
VGLSLPSLSSDQAVLELLRDLFGSGIAARVVEWHVRRPTYTVASVHTTRPRQHMLVKLEVPGERPNRHLDVMAAIARLVRQHTTVPTFDVLAVDVTRRVWPWEYLIVTELPGRTWQSLYPRLDADAHAVAQRQIGRAAAQLHGVPFDAFGELRSDELVLEGTTNARVALLSRARRRLKSPRYLELMQKALDAHAETFADVPGPTLCHEDLNPYNLLFELHDDARPVLTGVLDFESAWAGLGESDLARLEFWWFTRGTAVADGYEEVASLAAGYARRRPLLQLLWCLEYAEGHRLAQHQVDTNAVCEMLGIPSIELDKP